LVLFLVYFNSVFYNCFIQSFYIMSSYIIDILAPFKTWGGIEGKIVTLCREFLKYDISVNLLLARGGVTPYPNRIPDQVQIIDLSSRSKFDTVFKLAQYLRHHPPNVLLTAKDHAAIAAIISRALIRGTIPVYIKITNTPSEILRRPGKRILAKLIYPYATGAIAISEGVRENFLSHFKMVPERVTTIYNPTITPDFPERTAKTIYHSWLNKEAPPVIIGMGRLTPQKDFSTLLKAFARLRKRLNAKLIILGEGPARQELEDLTEELSISADVDLPGFVSDPLPWLARANLFALSSIYEGLGNVLIEALAVGLPVVSTDCPSGPREILENGRLGHLVPVGDVGSLANAIERSLNDEPPFDEIAKSLQRFQSGPVARQYLKFMGLLPG
jgi:glycosyltransferase involved in cell wall biosynthesis